ncbi:MAG: hypothetical protein ACM3SM_12035 [Bacteroidota bacterium]
MKLNYNKVVPAAAVILLTAILLFFFKYQKSRDWFDRKNLSIADLYAKNLKPLLSGSWLSAEDIFNFALYKQLPVNSDRSQTIQLGSDEQGNQFLEIRSVDGFNRTNNLRDFSMALGFNDKQKRQVDSILDSYRDRIEYKVLASGNDAIAVSADMWKVNQSLFSDLISFAYKVNKNALRRVYALDDNMMKRLEDDNRIAEQKMGADGPDDEFYFVTSDTVFSYNVNRFQKDIERNRRQLERDRNNLPKVKVNFKNELARLRNKTEFQLQFDNQHIRIVIPDAVGLPGGNELADSINREVRKHLRSAVPQAYSSFELNFDSGLNNSLKHNSDLNISVNLPDLDSLMTTAFKALDSLRLPDSRFRRQEELEKLDSLRKLYNDSGRKYRQKIRR